MNTTKAVTDDSTIITIILPLLPSFFFFGTSTPKGFIIIPLLPCPGFGSSSITEASEGVDGGDGGRPASVIPKY